MHGPVDPSGMPGVSFADNANLTFIASLDGREEDSPVVAAVRFLGGLIVQDELVRAPIRSPESGRDAQSGQLVAPEGAGRDTDRLPHLHLPVTVGVHHHQAVSHSGAVVDADRRTCRGPHDDGMPEAGLGGADDGRGVGTFGGNQHGLR